MQSFPCPFCGPRPEPEFLFVTEMGKTRPEPAVEVSAPVWAAYLHDVKNIKGEVAEVASGYAEPFTFDITSAVKPDAENQITIAGTRTFINETGTGGLLGPAYLFQEK